MNQPIAGRAESIGAAGIVRGEKEVRPVGHYWKALAPVLAGGALPLLPVPAGLTPNAWYYFALFVAVVIALVLEPIPAAAVGYLRFYLM